MRNKDYYGTDTTTQSKNVLPPSASRSVPVPTEAPEKKEGRGLPEDTQKRVIKIRKGGFGKVNPHRKSGVQAMTANEMSPEEKTRNRLPNQAVRIEDIIVDQDLYPRANIIEENVERLRGIGPNFKDPIVVTADMKLVDGAHRLRALQQDGFTEAEVDVYEYSSPAAVLQHAVELNCKHGYQLTNEEKKRWVRTTWSLDIGAEVQAKIVGVAPRTIQDWTKDLKTEAKQTRTATILHRRSEGQPVKEIAEELKVSESVVKRAGRKRPAAEMPPPGLEEVHIAGEPTLGPESDTTILRPATATGEIEMTEGLAKSIASDLSNGLAHLEQARNDCKTPSTEGIPSTEWEDILEKLDGVLAWFRARK
jgi:DNA-binding NarL/FixJ family response regulator